MKQRLKVPAKFWRGWGNKLDIKEGANINDADHKFHSLTPIDTVDLGIYESALDFVFANNNLKNVALSGAYGSGKSSVLATYKKRHTDKRFLHISLVLFHSEDKNPGCESGTKSTLSTETILEGKILNQLIHQIPSKQIPLTNFRVKKGTSKVRNILTAILATIGFILGLYAFFFLRWVSFVQALTADCLKNMLSFSSCAESRLVAGVAFLSIIGIFVYRLIKLQENRHIIKKAGVSGVEIEIFEESNESYFDKYLNEVLYLFENADTDAIVFEDIDRYDSCKIFERLREINTLVNNNRIGNPLRFFYLIKDDIFVSKDRTKFFDFIIPIVPIIDGSNSFNKFLEYFEIIGIIGKDGNGGVGIDLEFLQGLSLYIDDMRILQNICNEFSIYKSRIVTTEQDPNKMLALIAYKNLFPRDFAKLQLYQGFLLEIIGGNGKDRLIATEKARLESSIKQKNIELVAVKAENMIEDELSLIYAIKIWKEVACSWSAQTRKKELLSQKQYQQYKEIIDDYKKRVVHATNNKENRIAQIEEEISTLNNELVALIGKRLCEIISRENIDTLFRETDSKSETGVTETFTEIKNSLYFPMLKYLVREDFVNETYSDYITYFYENSLSRTDKIFLRSVTDKKAKEPSYKLDNADIVTSRLSVSYFKQEETLNYALFNFLLSDYVTGQKHLSKTSTFIQQIRENNLYSFLIRYVSITNKLDDFVKVLGKEWTSFINDFFTYSKMSAMPSEPVDTNDIFVKIIALTLFRLTGENENSLSFVDDASKAKLVEYVSNDPDLLNTDLVEIREVAAGIKRFGVKFVVINAGTANRKLLRLVYDDNSYVINYENILVMLKEYYPETELGNVATSGYTVIMSDTESSLAKYVNANIDAYADVMLENCDEKITDSQECAISIINNIEIEKTKRATYIEYLNTMILDLHDIVDTDLWEDLLNNADALDYSAINIVGYYTEKSKPLFDEPLIKFINKKGENITFGNIFKNDNEKIDFFRAVVKAVLLNNEIYKRFISQFTLHYKQFEINGLSIEKLAILDELDKITMTAESLQFIRENYSDYLYSFIVNHIKEYVEIVSDASVFVFEEICVLLDGQIDDVNKIELLKHTREKISVQEKNYSDEISAYILQNNYDDTDFEYLVGGYETFGAQTRAAILNLSIQQMAKLQTMLNSASRLLITDVLSSKSIVLKIKQNIFKITAQKATDDEIKQWLSKVGLDDFMRLYQKKTRHKFDKTPINVAVLEIFKNRQLISDYSLDEKSGKYKTSKRKVFSR